LESKGMDGPASGISRAVVKILEYNK